MGNNRKSRRNKKNREDEDQDLFFIGARLFLVLSIIILFHGVLNPPVEDLFLDSVFLLLVSIPLFLRYKKILKIPTIFEFIMVGVVFLHIVGHSFDLYYGWYPIFDKICHLGAGILVGVVAFTLILLWDYRDGKSDFQKTKVLVAVVFIVFLAGVVKELEEDWERSNLPSTGEERLKESSLPDYNPLHDSLWDLISDMGGALFAVIILLLGYAGYRRTLSSNKKRK